MAKTSWIMFLNCLLISFLSFVWFVIFSNIVWFLKNWCATVSRSTQFRTEYQCWIYYISGYLNVRKYLSVVKENLKCSSNFCIFYIAEAIFLMYIFFVMLSVTVMFEKVYRRVLLLRACIELCEAHMVKFELKPRIAKFHFFRSYKRWTLSETSLEKY